jgi:hypothetical protein
MEFHLRSIQNLQSAKLPQWVLYLAYTVAYLCVLPFFQHQTDVDTIGYIAAAEHYSEGNVLGGINGYWSPLLSWLLIPFLLCKVPALLAIKLIDLIAALIGLRYIDLIARQLNLSKFHSRICVLVAMPHLAMFSLCVSTPDLLAAISWISVAYYSLRAYSNPGILSVLQLGVAGIAGYFAKYYHFYAFILLMIVLLLTALSQKNKPAATRYIQTTLLFLFLSSAWMYTLYVKHGIFSPTTSAAHNLYTSQHPGATNHPQVGEHILPLDYEKYRYTAWEYVPEYITSEDLKPASSEIDLSTHFQRIVQNIIKGIRYFYLETLLLVLSLLLLFRSGVLRTNKPIALFILILAIYPLGYYATAVDYRYLLFCVLSTIILAALALKYTNMVFPQAAIIFLLAGSFSLPIHRTLQFEHKGEKYFEMNSFFNASGQLEGKHIVSSPKTWSRAIGLCYQSKAKYYDTLLPEKVTTLNSELDTYSIRYYLCLANEVTEEMKHAGEILYYDKYALVHLNKE